MGRKKTKAKASRQRADKEKLELFLKLAAELGTSALAKKGFGLKQSIKWSKSEGLRHELEEPDENDLRAFLITFRKFISEDSDVYLQRIHGIFYRRLTREDYREDVGAMNAQWRKHFTKGWVRFKINGHEISPEYALKIYINGRYFHDDLDYAQELETIEHHDPIGAKLQRGLFLSAIIETSNYVGWLAGNIDYCLRENLLGFDDQP